jgi:hypothetical protein
MDLAFILTTMAMLVMAPFMSSATCGDDGICDDVIPETLDADADGDGFYVSQGDCYDSNQYVFPGAADGCDGIDNDCDGIVDNNGDEQCADSSYCNGQEYCDGANGCKDGVAVDCSPYTFSEIASCTYDDNAMTWDYRAAFESYCDDGLMQCTQGDSTIYHTCDRSYCYAECTDDFECTDSCDGNIRDFQGSCVSCGCVFVTEDCDSLDGWYDTTQAPYWVNATACKRELRQNQQHLEYDCNAGECVSDPDITRYIVLKAENIDNDNDGVCNSEDMCPNTALPEQIQMLSFQRYADIDADNIFETRRRILVPVVDSAYSLSSTKGCSCMQILDMKKGINMGEKKLGCTEETIKKFIRFNR